MKRILKSAPLAICLGMVSAFSVYAQGTWENKADMLQHRAGGASAVIDDILYVIGGSIAGNTAAGVEYYDASTDTWFFGNGAMLNARSDLGYGVIGGKVYLAEGWLNSDSDNATNALEIY